MVDRALDHKLDPQTPTVQLQNDLFYFSFNIIQNVFKRNEETGNLCSIIFSSRYLCSCSNNLTVIGLLSGSIVLSTVSNENLDSACAVVYDSK